MKYLDEFSDPDLAKQAARPDPRGHHPALGDDGGLRRPDPLDHPARHRPAAARRHRDDPRPRLPGVRDAAGDHRQGARDRRAPGRDLLLVRRHAPGARAASKDLFRVKSAGGDVRVVYSPLDALKLARENPDRQVVFFGIGFETTAPANAMTVYQAKRLGIENFSLLVSHVLVPPAIAAIMESPTCRVQAFLAAGHVCSVMGTARVPAARRAVPACRSWSPASSRSTSSRASGAPCTSSRRAGTSSRTPTRASVRAEGNPAAMEMLRRRLRGDRPDLARHRDDPAERLAALASATASSTPSTASRSTDIHTEESPLCRSRRGAAGADQAARVRGVRQGVHAAQPARRDDGVVARAPARRTTSTAGWSCLELVGDAARGVPMSNDLDFEGWVCPLPLRDTPTIVMGHGGGGAMSGELVEHLFLPAFGDAARRRARRLGGADRAGRAGWRSRPTRSWSSRCSSPAAPSATSRSTAPSTTWRCRGAHAAVPVDRVHPGGGHRADRHRPRSRRRSARRREVAGVQLVTGDTKVVDSGSGDGVYVNTAGIGLVADGVDIGPRPGPGRRRRDRQRRHRRARHRGDELPRGPGVRHRRSRATPPPLHGLVADDARHRRRRARAARPDPRRRRGDAERDRPGLRGRASSWSSATCRSRPRSRDACGLLGLDPLQVANEGKLLAIVPGRPGRRGAGRDAGAPARARGPADRHLRRGAPADGGRRAPGSAAPGWSTCRSASSCRGSAEADPPAGRGAFAQYAYPPNELGYCGPPGRRGDARARRDRRDRAAGPAVRGRLELPRAARRGGSACDDPLATRGGGGLLGRQRAAGPGRPGRPGGPAGRTGSAGQVGGTWREARDRARAAPQLPGVRGLPLGRDCCARAAAGPAVNVLDRCRIRTGVVRSVDGE